MHIFLIERTVKYFNISASAINVLFMLHSKLNNKSFIFITKRSKFPTESVKPCVLRCLDAWEKFDKMGSLHKWILYFVINYLSTLNSFKYLYHFLDRSRTFRSLKQTFRIPCQDARNRPNSFPMNLKYWQFFCEYIYIKQLLMYILLIIKLDLTKLTFFNKIYIWR